LKAVRLSAADGSASQTRKHRAAADQQLDFGLKNDEAPNKNPAPRRRFR